jgi:propanol-preferring alcohol dehydrogenase
MTAACYAMQLDGVGQQLRRSLRTLPVAGPGMVAMRVLACGVCRTDLHVIDGEVAAIYPIVPGHEVVGRVLSVGVGITGIEIGDRLGVPWLGAACGVCRYCLADQENLCDRPIFTGATRDGGYATHIVADARFCLAIPPEFDDVAAAPLLCAGLIGHRALRMTDDGERLGLYGFGAAAHIVTQVARWQGREVHALTRPGDHAAQDFARHLGCASAGGSDAPPPVELDAAIIFAPVGELVPAALRAVCKGGRVVCAGIHMSDIPSFAYADLWGERSLLSVANLTRADGRAFLQLAPKIPVRTTTHVFALSDANAALARVRAGDLDGAAVLVPDTQQ